MSLDPPSQQHISGVSTQNHSQSFIVSARDAYFTVSHDSKEASEQACRNALFLTNPHVDRERLVSAKGVRVAGTCEWITHEASYRTWLNSNSDGDGDGDGDSDTRLLWISGGPGKGKTMMSVFLTEELERHTAHIDSAELVFFFCSAEDEKRSTATAILRGLVHQIIVKRPQLVKHALPHFETPERTQQTVSSLETLWLIFTKLIADANLGTIFCVLDGLDECEDSTLGVLLPRIVHFLTNESPSTKGRFKLAIVSRDLLGLRGCTTRVRLDPDNDERVASDIELFVSARVRELSRVEGFDEFQASVQTALLQRAEGTFLWVGFAMDELLQRKTCSQILEALKDLPSGLPAIYSRMLRHIPAKQRKISLTILRWVTIAVRPLELRELAAAIGIQDTPQMTVERAARDAIALCGPLLKVQEQEIGLVHQSARDYLLRIERDSDVVLEAFRLNFESSHLELARKCLDCIAQSDLQYRVVDLDAKLDFRMSPLLRYAVLHWPEHAKSCSTLAAKLFDPPGLFFKKTSPLRDNWSRAYTGMRGHFYVPIPLLPIPLLHMACLFEIIPWIEVVGAEKSWWLGYHKCVNEKDSNGMTALHLAALGDKEAMVRLLVDRGADVKAKDNDGKTVLHYAAGTNEAIVRLLVDKGADVRAKDNNGRTALHWAASSWTENTAVLQLLMDRGADVKAKDNNGETVLHSAASSWVKNTAVLQLLMDRGADVKAKDNNGRTVLHSAASSWVKNTAVLQLLMDRGADVKAKDNNGRTVLHSAASSWIKNTAVLQLLMDRGADVKAKDNDGRTALHLVALGGKEAVVRLLLDRRDDIEAKDNDGKTALHLAALGGKEAVVRLLVDRGVDIEAKNSDGKTALHCAVSKGREAAVRLLVDSGADVDAKDTNGMTALHHEALLWRGKETVVQVLVDLRADVKANDNNGMMALHWASWTRNEAVVQLLVDLGADIKAKNNNGETALHWAASLTRNEAVVQLLVGLGADVKAKDTKGVTALHWAASLTRNEAVVQLLVDRGADVKTKDNKGMTALHWAVSWTRNEAVVKLLVDLGADVGAKDNNGTTALHLAAWDGKEAVVRLLVDLGADLEGEGEMALYSAAARGNTVVVRLLLDLRADAKARNNKGRTVLHWAAERVAIEVLVWLLLGLAMDIEAEDTKRRMRLQ